MSGPAEFSQRSESRNRRQAKAKRPIDASIHRSVLCEGVGSSGFPDPKGEVPCTETNTLIPNKMLAKRTLSALLKNKQPQRRWLQNGAVSIMLSLVFSTPPSAQETTLSVFWPPVSPPKNPGESMHSKLAFLGLLTPKGHWQCQRLKPHSTGLGCFLGTSSLFLRVPVGLETCPFRVATIAKRCPIFLCQGCNKSTGRTFPLSERARGAFPSASCKVLQLVLGGIKTSKLSGSRSWFLRGRSQASLKLVGKPL